VKCVFFFKHVRNKYIACMHRSPLFLILFSMMFWDLLVLLLCLVIVNVFFIGCYSRCTLIYLVLKKSEVVSTFLMNLFLVLISNVLSNNLLALIPLNKIVQKSIHYGSCSLPAMRYVGSSDLLCSYLCLSA